MSACAVPTIEATAIGARRNWRARALVVLALSLLAHAVALVVGRRALEIPAPDFDAEHVIEVSLQTAPPVPAAVETPPAPRRTVKRAPRPPPAPAPVEEAAPSPTASPAPVESVPASDPMPAESVPAEPETAAARGEEMPEPGVEPEPMPAAPNVPMAGEFDASGAALLAQIGHPPLQRAWLPVSARYAYRTTDTRFPAVTGATTVHWRFEEDHRYSARLVTTVFGLSVLDLESTGRVQRFGLAPDRYTEKTVGRTEWATNFDWSTRRVTFSASNVEHELREGIQDRLSFQFQLMALGQRLPDRFRPGATIVLSVGGRNDIALYRLHVIGSERLQTGVGEFDTVKLERPKSDDNRDSRIEVWLAPDAAWLPVKLRFTDRRDQVTENLLSEVAIPAP